MLRYFLSCLAVVVSCCAMLAAQDAQAPASAKPTEHVLGTVTAIDQAAHTITVKEDKTGAEQKIQLANTRTLLKVPPSAKDLKSATRITANDLAVGDRVDVRGFKALDDPNAIAARSVVLMSARDLEAAHQAEAAAWQHSTGGLVNSVDAASGKLTITTPTPEGPKPVEVDASKETQFTRYSPATPKTPVPSQLSEIKPGDQVRIIGQTNPENTVITAQKIYSGAFRTIGGTVSSVSPDGKEITLKAAGTNQPVEVSLNADSTVRKLPPDVALRLAMRLNPTYRATQPGAAPAPGTQVAGAPPYGAKAGEQPGGNGSGGGWRERAGNGEGGGPARAGGGNLAAFLERVPPISVSDLKPGDAVIVAGVAPNEDNSHLIATNVIAGAEAILRAAPPRNGQSQNLNWDLGMQAPAEQ
ncbi:MAG TPA: DUF5666 domain-containing protein [Bryobacteraceae bacterium]|jgi:Cu/Ag efflux protein CusF|nr:DUF5666 domain-containing protein [Bryobacteraceae bacterium]